MTSAAIVLFKAETSKPLFLKLQPGSFLLRKSHISTISTVVVSARLRAGGTPLVVIEENEAVVKELQDGGVTVIVGNAAEPGALERAGIVTARWLISAIPDAFEGGALVERARAANPSLRIIARAHSDEEVAHLLNLGADLVIMGEAEIARGICEDIMGETARSVDRQDTVGA